LRLAAAEERAEPDVPDMLFKLNKESLAGVFLSDKGEY